MPFVFMRSKTTTNCPNCEGYGRWKYNGWGYDEYLDVIEDYRETWVCIGDGDWETPMRNSDPCWRLRFFRGYLFIYCKDSHVITERLLKRSPLPDQSQWGALYDKLLFNLGDKNGK